MLIEKRRDYELEQRRGLARRTFFQTIWLLISGVMAYFFVRYLLDNGVLTYDMIYTQLGLPRTIPEWALLAVMIVLLVIIMQFFFMLGYFIVSPRGRTRVGKATLRSAAHDPLEDQYRR
jgi:hypothetical protein